MARERLPFVGVPVPDSTADSDRDIIVTSSISSVSGAALFAYLLSRRPGPAVSVVKELYIAPEILTFMSSLLAFF